MKMGRNVEKRRARERRRAKAVRKLGELLAVKGIPES
jgi:hypothetical protein